MPNIWDHLSPQARIRALHHGNRGASVPYKTVMGRNPKQSDMKRMKTTEGYVDGAYFKKYNKKMLDFSKMKYDNLPKNIKAFARGGMKDQGMG